MWLTIVHQHVTNHDSPCSLWEPAALQRLSQGLFGKISSGQLRHWQHDGVGRLQPSLGMLKLDVWCSQNQAAPKKKTTSCLSMVVSPNSWIVGLSMFLPDKKMIIFSGLLIRGHFEPQSMDRRFEVNWVINFKLIYFWDLFYLEAKIEAWFEAKWVFSKTVNWLSADWYSNKTNSTINQGQ